MDPSWSAKRWAVAVGIVLGVGGVAIADPGGERDAPLERGDLDGNGIYDFDDVAILRDALSGVPMRIDKNLLDVNVDGSIDEDDLEMLTGWAERTVGAGGDPGGEVSEEEAPDAGEVPAGTEPERVLRGDVDGDGDLDLADAILMQEVVFGLVRPRGGFASADVNQDGTIDLADLIALVEILWPRGGTSR